MDRRACGRGYLVAALALACACGPAESEANAPPPLPGFEYTAEVGLRQRHRSAREAYTVAASLPSVDFATLRGAMLGAEDAVIVDPHLGSFANRRVRIHGYALPLRETRDAVRFVLQEIPYTGAGEDLFPPPNGQILVLLDPAQSFDYTDAPLWVEGYLRFGLFPTFADDAVALFALESARVQVLPAPDLDIPLFVVPPEGYHPRPDLELFPGGGTRTTEAK
jgi:hypothetical protein